MTNRHSNDRYFPLQVQIRARAWNDFGLTAELLRDPSISHLYGLRLLSLGMGLKEPERQVSAGQLNLLALLNRTFRFMIDRYFSLRRCSFGFEEAEIAAQKISLPTLRPTLESFVELFPPAAVHLGQEPRDFLGGDEGEAHRRLTMMELFILSVQAGNPAAAPMIVLFDDSELNDRISYRRTLTSLDERLGLEASHGALGGSLLELLQAPLRAAPHSLAGQLEYIQRNWGQFLPPELLSGILTAFDVVREETQMRSFGRGPIEVPRFARTDLQYDEPERFSPDADWMSNVVLIAKTIYVWLDQLSKKYGRAITRLDHIPDEEIDQLARWGFNSLWLIGIWERSPASQKIKQIMGNPEAVSSAYSLYDYVVSHDLGGEEAIADLQRRCEARGIRLGCDVVPNHTGIYSKWTREHPDWFVQLDHPPYPSYRFTGPDLSFSDDVSLRVEDGYWNHSDAAVVFQHVDRHSGRVRYIYHGNDGTHLPWNDTAQLNFLLPEVREAMIQTILHVARRYKIIRFDAAMTLAKKHYQRLWFPQPGGGAGVPSRAEHAMSREDFERAFPVEFWREVVDRVAAEVPDTLLLAEAFWLMEGYFVRTLGMHRVYNSAFMNMFKTEDNAKYRSVIKNILDFNPEILKRFVNFMNNPDEATAVEQFGHGEKYFGVAVMLVTMPGLPMFGHGQIEGLREKYGMEYRKAYWDEKVDEGMRRHHEDQIFPLMRRRWLFSGSEDFVLYDFFAGDHVNEDVIAYSNRRGSERALIAFYNRHGHTSGWLRTSVPKKVKDGSGAETTVSPDLGRALGLSAEEKHYYRFRDFRTGLEYLRRGRELCEQGLHLEFGPYQYYALLDFREIVDEDGSWGWLCHTLQGRPVASLDLEWKKIRYAPLLEAFRHAVFPGLLKGFGALLSGDEKGWSASSLPQSFRQNAADFYAVLKQTASLDGEPAEAVRGVSDDLEALRRAARLKGKTAGEKSAVEALDLRVKGGKVSSELLRIVLPSIILRRIRALQPEATPHQVARWTEEYLLLHTLQEVLSVGDPPFDLSHWEAAGEVQLVQLLLRHGGPTQELRSRFLDLLEDPDACTYLGCNVYDGVEWFNRERLETLAKGFFHAEAIAALEDAKEEPAALLAEIHDFFVEVARQADESGCRFAALRKAMATKV